jgi:hypothetical protein
MPDLSIIIPVTGNVAHLTAFLATLAPLRSRGVQIVVVDGATKTAQSSGTQPVATGATAQPAQKAPARSSGPVAANATIAAAMPGGATSTPAITDSSTAAATVGAACSDARGEALADLVLSAAPGRASQMNTGARHARAASLLFLPVGLRLPADVDRLVKAALQDHHWGHFTLEAKSRHLPAVVAAAAADLISRLTGVASLHQAIFVKRALFRQLGGFDESAAFEDEELTRRLRRAAAPASLRQRVGLPPGDHRDQARGASLAFGAGRASPRPGWRRLFARFIEGGVRNPSRYRKH